MNVILTSLLLLPLITVGGDTVTISSSCNDKNVDGLYYIKPTENGEIIPVICNDGYTMLDASLNFDQVSSYFTTLYQYGSDARSTYGTDCSETSGWRDWFIPANDMTQFRVAVGCTECQSGGRYGDNTAYYMTNGYFCPINGEGEGCDMSSDDYDPTNIFCNICDDQDGLCGTGGGREGIENGNWCDCYTLQLTADSNTPVDWDNYCEAGMFYRPNFVVDRSACTCYKPDESENKVYHDIAISDLPLVSTDYLDDIEASGLYIDDSIQWDESDSDSNEAECLARFTYLTNDDFKHGTYRITECGNYLLDEDIVLNFNKPLKTFSYEDGDSPNAYDLDNLHWYPTEAQQESGEYFGVDAFWGAFTLGFFAGISIETEHVYINLNGHSIGMDPEYYLQQRFFAIIELGNKQFQSKQGPVDFGRNDIEISDIVIRDGVLGLTSHHGIHGIGAHNVQITDVHIMNFDTHGIHLNGCTWVTIQDTEIGPQNTNIPVLGRWVHARALLPRLRLLVEEYGDQELRFANRRKRQTVKELADRLVEQMDMIYYHVTQGLDFSGRDEWAHAQKTFLNPTGWLDGGSAYGILFNGQGTAVVNIGRRATGTFHNTIKNVKIHDIKLKPHEEYWTEIDGKIAHGFFFETLQWNYGDLYDEENGYYTGDAYTDLLLAGNEFFADEFCPLGSLFYMNGIRDWAFMDGMNVWRDVAPEFMCGSDIQSHSTKGAIGIRIDGTKNFRIEDVEISNLVNWGDLGSDACGEYEAITFAVGFDTDKDIQWGYTGNNVHGILTDYATGIIKNVQINNLKSWTGSTHGIALYKGTTVELEEDIRINNLVAGAKMSQDESDALILPNAPPFVCSIFIGPNSDSATNPENTPVVQTGYTLTLMVANEMYGYDYCDQSSRVGEMIEPMSPEILQLNVNGHFILGSSILGTYHFNTITVASLISIAIFIAFCIKGWVFDKKPKINSLVNDNQKSGTYGSI